MIAQDYPTLKEEKPEYFDNEYERILVLGAAPDVNAAAREVIALAKAKPCAPASPRALDVPDTAARQTRPATSGAAGLK